MKNITILLLILIFVLPSCRHHRQANQQNENNINEIQILSDITYGTEKLQKLDIYIPANAKEKRLPVHIYVHGGGWFRGDKSSAKEHGNFYANKDIVFVSLNYRLAPEDKHPAQVSDVAKGVRWVVDNIEKYGGNPNNIYISGHSAGAHIISLATTEAQYLNANGLEPAIFKKVIPVDTASFDLNAKVRGKERLVIRRINQNFGRSQRAKREASPIYQVNKNMGNPEYALPEFMMFVTSNRPDAVKQTEEFNRILNLAGTKSEYTVIKGKTHKEMNELISGENSIIANKILDEIKQP